MLGGFDKSVAIFTRIFVYNIKDLKFDKKFSKDYI